MQLSEWGKGCFALSGAGTQVCAEREIGEIWAVSCLVVALWKGLQSWSICVSSFTESGGMEKDLGN